MRQLLYSRAGDFFDAATSVVHLTGSMRCKIHTFFFDAAFLMRQLLYSRAGDFFDAATSVQ
jgi:hypothetical protein